MAHVNLRIFARLGINLASLLIFTWLLFFVSTGRGPDFTDEGFYLYDAWAAWKGKAPQSLPLFINQGYILGLPYLWSDESGIVGIRLWSQALWFGSFILFFYSCSIRFRAPTLVGSVLVTTPALSTLMIPCASYQTLPPALFLAAIACCLLHDHFKLICVRLSLAICTGACLGLAVIAYTPAIAAVLCFSAIRYIQRPTEKLYLSISLILPLIVCASIILTHSISSVSSELISVTPTLSPTEILGRAAWRLGLLMLFSTSIALFSVIILRVLDGIFLPPETPSQRSLRDAVYLSLVTFLSIALFLIHREHHLLNFFRHPLFTIGIFCLTWALTRKAREQQVVKSIMWSLLPILPLCILQESLGSILPPYYINYTSPAVVGAVFLFCLSEIKRHEFIGKLAGLVIFFSLTFIATLSVLVFLTKSYRASSSLQSSHGITGPKFSMLRMSAIRAETILDLRKQYLELDCDSLFFAALDRTPLAYFILERESPFGVSWIRIRRPEYAELIRDQAAGCVVFREGFFRMSLQGRMAFIEWLGFDEGDGLEVRRVGSEGIALLKFKRGP